MYYYDELSVKEIAETLGCSTGTVKSRLNYARKYIKKEVEKTRKERNEALQYCTNFIPYMDVA